METLTYVRQRNYRSLKAVLVTLQGPARGQRVTKASERSHGDPGLAGDPEPGSGRSSPSSAPVAPGGTGGGSSAPRRDRTMNGPPETPAAKRSRPPPLPTQPPAGRAGPARLRRELRPPHASAHR